MSNQNTNKCARMIESNATAETTCTFTKELCTPTECADCVHFQPYETEEELIARVDKEQFEDLDDIYVRINLSNGYNEPNASWIINSQQELDKTITNIDKRNSTVTNKTDFIKYRIINYKK